MSKYNYNEIKSRYLQGETAKSIADSLGTYNTTIRRILMRQHVKLRGPSEALSKINVDKFLISSPTRDYWLGFLAADGHISSSKFAIEINVAEKDKRHLQKYADWLEIGLKCYKHKKFNVNQYRAVFCNKQAHSYLVDIGITPRKSRTIKLNIPLNSHILRGIIDGDGYVRKVGRNKSYVEIASCSEPLVNQIASFLHKEGIAISSIREASNDLKLICLYSQEQVKKLYNLVYKDAAVFLERKQKRFTATLSWKDGRKNTLNSGNQHRES